MSDIIGYTTLNFTSKGLELLNVIVKPPIRKGESSTFGCDLLVRV